MNVNWMEPPAWWVKWKPLRWVLAIVVLYWFFGTLMPRLREDPPLPAVPVTMKSEPAAAVAEPPAQPASIAALPATPLPTKPAKLPSAPPSRAAAEDKKPADAAPTPAPVPAPKAEAASSTAAEAVAPTTAGQATAGQDEVEAPDPAAPYTAVEATRVEMLNGLRSYENLAAIQAILAQAGFASVLSTINKDTQGGRYPPYRSDTLVVSSYQHAGFDGLLTLEFFNDRLYQAHFAPKRPADYLGWLRSHGTPLPVKRTGRSTLTRGDLEVTTNIDFAVTEVGSLMGTKPYVQWTDTRLSMQMRNWGPIS